MNRPDTTTTSEIFVKEVFSAIQGEGALVGERQVFVRLAGCNIRCSYCDQPEALEKVPGRCRIERSPGKRDWKMWDSPLEISRLVDAADSLWRTLPHHSLSLTGGEPLFQGSRLESLLPELVGRGHRVMLETNGTLSSELERLVDHVDYISMDIKLTSVDGQGVQLDKHRRFLEIASSRRAFVKIVLGPSTDLEELAEALRMVESVSSELEVFLQPVTPFAAVVAAPSPQQVLALHAQALRIHRRTRVVPQTHKLIGQL